MKMVLMGRASFGNNNNTIRACPIGQSSTGTIDAVALVVPCDCTLTEWGAELESTLTGAQIQTIKLYRIKNSDGSTEQLTTATSGLGSTAMIGSITNSALERGDRIYMERTASGAPPAQDILWAFTVDMTTSGLAWTSASMSSAPSTTVTSYYGIYGATTQSATLANNIAIPTFNITINDICIVATNFSGGQFVVGLYVNGTLQDGSGGAGGSIDTRQTFTSNGSRLIGSLSISVASTSDMVWGIVPSGSPSANTRFTFGMAYTPVTDGLSFHAFVAQTNIGTVLNYFAPGSEVAATVEANRNLKNLTSTSFTSGRLGRNIVTAVGSGARTRTLSLRKNNAEFSTPISITMNNATPAGTGFTSTTQQTVSPNDTLNFKSDVSATTPNNTRGSLVHDMFIAPAVSGSPWHSYRQMRT